MDKVVHFEIPAEKMERAEKFYKACFGWEINSIPEMKYAMVMTGPVEKNHRPSESGYINGGMMQRTDPIVSPVITIQVQKMDAAVEKVKKAGGSVVKEPFAVGDMGISAYVKDSEGNIIGLWQTVKK